MFSDSQESIREWYLSMFGQFIREYELYIETWVRVRNYPRLDVVTTRYKGGS